MWIPATYNADLPDRQPFRPMRTPFAYRHVFTLKLEMTTRYAFCESVQHRALEATGSGERSSASSGNNKLSVGNSDEAI
jgi:hypothetical protein